MRQNETVLGTNVTVRRRWRWWIAGLAVLGIVGINAIAFVQAWSMTHFVVGGERTAPPEHLSVAGKMWVMLTGVHILQPQNLLSPADFDLSFQIRHVTSGRFDLETWVIPAVAKPHGWVLLYHGYAASKSSLLPAAKEFHEMGYDLELVDFRGSGGSTGNATTIGYREADDVMATAIDARQKLMLSDQPLFLFGQSMGAAAVLRAVGDLGLPRSSVNAIIIESTYDRLLSTAGNRFHVMHLPAFPLAHLLIFWGGVQQGYWGFNMNPVRSAERVQCPVLMFHGELDARVTNEQAMNVFDHLNGEKQLEWYTQAGHTAFLSSDPARWRTSVSVFLSRHLR